MVSKRWREGKDVVFGVSKRWRDEEDVGLSEHREEEMEGWGYGHGPGAGTQLFNRADRAQAGPCVAVTQP